MDRVRVKNFTVVRKKCYIIIHDLTFSLVLNTFGK